MKCVNRLGCEKKNMQREKKSDSKLARLTVLLQIQYLSKVL